MGFLAILTGQPKDVPPPPAPAGDLEGDLAAAGLPAGSSPAAPGPGAARGLPGLEKPTGDALIAFVESWVPLVVRGYAQVNGRVWDRECDAACRLSITERQNLSLTADAAAPFVARLIAHSEKLAALAFVVQLGFVFAGKFALVKSKPLAKKAAEVERTEAHESEIEAPPAPKPAPVHRRPVGRPPARKR